MQRLLTRSAVALTLLCAFTSTVANADINGDILSISVSSGGMSGTWIANPDDGYWDANGDYHYDLPGPIDIMDSTDGSTVLATLDEASIIYIQDPQVNLDFAMSAGAALTTIEVASALNAFPTINPAVGQASVGLTVADVLGDGVTATGSTIQGNGFAYAAQYNGMAAANLGTSFAEAISSLSAGPFGTNSVSVDVPGGGGTLPIGVAVDDMSAVWRFDLTAFDVATGTSVYVITPEPSAFALLGLGLLLVRRR